MALRTIFRMCSVVTGLRNCGVPRKMAAEKMGLFTTHDRSISSLDDYASLREHFMQFKGGSVDLVKDNETGIAVITLNNPDVKNAMTGKMMADLYDTVGDLEVWNAGKGVILRGSGTTFCSGGDLGTVRQICNQANGIKMSVFMHNITSRLLQIPMISVATIQGTALGGGAELTTACDFRLMTQGARIGFVQIKLGVLTGWGGGTRLTKLLGKSKALEVLASGKMYDSKEAKSIGLINDILPDDSDPEDSANEWLNRFCCWDPAAVSYTKSIVSVAERSPYEHALSFERECFSDVWGKPVHLNALNRNIKHS
ncbi:hypothetical protein ScPMuIL_001461 [Solemya velum]